MSGEITAIKARDSVIDICRFIGITLVVIGHSGCPQIIKSWIYLFHMSLFFALSGYCYSKRYDDHPIDYFTKKVKTIYLPYVVFSIGLILFHNLFISIGLYGSSESFLLLENGNEYGIIPFYSARELVKQIVRTMLFASNEEFGGATWFLRILFIVNIFYNFFRFLAKNYLKFDDNRIFVSSVIIGVLALFLGCGCDYYNIHLPLELQTCFSAFFAFEVGVVFKKITDKAKTKNCILLSISTCLALLALTHFGSIGLGLNSVGEPWFYFAATILGLLFTYSTSIFIQKKITGKMVQCFVLIGKHSLSIVFYHFMAFKIVTLFQILLTNGDYIHLGCFPVCNTHGMWWTVYSLAGMLVPISIAIIWGKVRNGFKNAKRKKC